MKTSSRLRMWSRWLWAGLGGACALSAGLWLASPYLFGKGQAAQVVRSLGSLTARREKCALVSLEQFNPRRDVAGVANVAVKSKFSGQERGAEFGNKFLRSVSARAVKAR